MHRMTAPQPNLFHSLSLLTPFFIPSDIKKKAKIDTVSKSVSETVSHRSDDAKLIDKLKSQIKFITFVMQEYSKTYSTKDQAACNKALQTLDGRIHPGVAMMTAPFFLYVWFRKQ